MIPTFVGLPYHKLLYAVALRSRFLKKDHERDRFIQEGFAHNHNSSIIIHTSVFNKVEEGFLRFNIYFPLSSIKAIDAFWNMGYETSEIHLPQKQTHNSNPTLR